MSRNTIKIDNFRPLKGKVFVTDLEAGVRLTTSGIIIPDDDMRNSGIRNRWARVWAIGPEVYDVIVGDWILLEHGRWTNGIDLEIPSGEVIRVWMADYPEHALMAADHDPRPDKMITYEVAKPTE